jgi:oligosaccharide repeat unit polymerase
MKNFKIRKVLIIPSFYGLLVWIPLSLLLSFQVISVDVSREAYFIFVFTILCFVVSGTINYLIDFNIPSGGINSIVYTSIDKLFFIFFLIVGIYGLYIYVQDFTLHLGGEDFFTVFISDPLKIRALAAEESSIGFQLSYLTWILVPYFIYFSKITPTKNAKITFWICVLVVFFANTLFIDRTRPILLLFISVLTYFIFSNKSAKKNVRIITLVLIGAISIFFVQAIFTGKYDKNDGLWDNFLIYVLGGFGFFSSALADEVNGFGFSNTLLPIYKIFYFLGFIDYSPSQILEFRSIPFQTNVGTFLQPLVADGGWVFVIFGLPLLIFGLDYISLKSLESKNIAGIFLWANIISSNLLCFFTPKYNSTYFYIFLFMFIFSIFINRLCKKLFA